MRQRLGRQSKPFPQVEITKARGYSFDTRGRFFLTWGDGAWNALTGLVESDTIGHLRGN